jgi:hypothetical protein
MAEIAGQMKNECAGRIRYTGWGLPRRSIVRVRGNLTIESAQLTQDHYANSIADNKKILGHGRESRRVRERAIGTTPGAEEEVVVVVVE